MVLVLSSYSNSYSAIKGTGELKMSERAVNHFIDWIRTKKVLNGNRCKPSMFIMSSNGDWTQGNICCWTSCEDTLSTKIIKECERATGVLCGVFSIRRSIYWDNGINNMKKKAKFSSKMSDTEVRTKLEQLGFLGNNIAANIEKKEKQKKVTKKESDNSNFIDDLKELKELYESGVLSKEEFERAKEKLLN
tara:strand:+ start:271 stop:843 length:573 start_codon:yes stop_codon:yes gene_type:complete